MGAPFIIIDGYNLMHAAGVARARYGPGELEICRRRFLRLLASRLSEEALLRTTVVFDAFASTDDLGRHPTDGPVTVVFAPAGTDADSEIECLIASHTAPRQLLVVSGDQRLQKAAGRRRATAVDSHVFWSCLEDDTGSLRGHSEGKPGSTDSDVWLQTFGGVEISDDISAPPTDVVFDDAYLSDLENEFED